MDRFGLMNGVPIKKKQKSNPIFKGQYRRHPHIIPIRRNTQAKNLNGLSAQEAKYNLFGIDKIPANNRKEPDPNLQPSETSLDISSFCPKVSSTQINGIGNMPLSTDTTDEGFFNISTEFMSENNKTISDKKRDTSSNAMDTANNGIDLSFNKTSSNKESRKNIINKNDVRHQSIRSNNNYYRNDFNVSDDKNNLNRTFNFNVDPVCESAAPPCNNTFDNINLNNFHDFGVADSNCKKDSNIYDFLDNTKNYCHYVNNARRPDAKLTRPGYSNSEILNWLDPKEIGVAKPKYSQDFQNNISTFEKSKYSSDLNYQNDANFEWETPTFPKNDKKFRFTDQDIALDNHKSSSKKIPICNGRGMDKKSSSFNTTNDDILSYGSDYSKDFNCSKVNDYDLLRYPDCLDSKEIEVKKRKCSKDFQRNNISSHDKSEQSSDQNNIFFDWALPTFPERYRKSRSTTRKLNNFVVADDILLDGHGHTPSSRKFPIFDGSNMDKKSSSFNTTNNDQFFLYGTNFSKDFHSSEVTAQDLIKYPDNPYQSKTTKVYNTKNAPTHINIFL